MVSRFRVIYATFLLLLLCYCTAACAGATTQIFSSALPSHSKWGGKKFAWSTEAQRLKRKQNTPSTVPLFFWSSCFHAQHHRICESSGAWTPFWACVRLNFLSFLSKCTTVEWNLQLYVLVLSAFVVRRYGVREFIAAKCALDKHAKSAVLFAGATRASAVLWCQRKGDPKTSSTDNKRCGGCHQPREGECQYVELITQLKNNH